jgi:putative zinc finger/helix-turn-helix YgiT family protein
MYCDECKKECKYDVVFKTGIFTVRGKEIETQYRVAQCRSCENELYDELLDNETMKQINDTYIKQYGGMPLEEIRDIRLNYKGLGSRPFAKILGMGTASVTRHEAGDLPSEKSLEIYRKLQKDPQLILEYFNQNKHTLTPRELKKVEEVLHNWEVEHKNTFRSENIIEPMQDDEEIIESIHKPFEHSNLTGYLAFDLDKFLNMILYFTQNGVQKTKLMKLLWYSDFLQFKRQSVSISGAVYTRMALGPVPKDHDITLAHLQHMEAIEIEETILNDEGWTKMTVKAMQEFDPALFNTTELTILEEVQSAFRDYGSRKISNYSHEELAWLETAAEQPIDYKYARDLREIEQV